MHPLVLGYLLFGKSSATGNFLCPPLSKFLNARVSSLLECEIDQNTRPSAQGSVHQNLDFDILFHKFCFYGGRDALLQKLKVVLLDGHFHRQHPATQTQKNGWYTLLMLEIPGKTAKTQTQTGSF